MNIEQKTDLDNREIIMKQFEKELQSEITPETVLRQCMRMNENSDLDVFFSFSGHVNQINVYVKTKEYLDDPIYNKTCYLDGDIPPVTLAEIYNDLIKIEHKYTGERNE